MKKVAIIGTVGVPAKYGGFETLVENIIGENCSPEIEYTIYCSSKSYIQQLKKYKGAFLKYIPLKANGAQSIIYDIISIIDAVKKSDVLLVLGVSGCIILPFIRLFSSKKIIVNIDGLEHQRDKWSPKVRRFLKFSEKMAVHNANIVISDNKAIQDYVREEYGIESEFIAYGGDHVLCGVREIQANVLAQYHVRSGEYCFSLCRIEPENNVHLILEAFAQNGKKILFVGNWDKNEYGKCLLKKYGSFENIEMLSPIYTLPELNVLRSNCLFYLHGHSAGGTNPSLVEAMFFGKPILAFDVTYNRETTQNYAHYFSSVDNLIELLRKSYDFYNENAFSMRVIANSHYCWARISEQYTQLYFEDRIK